MYIRTKDGRIIAFGKLNEVSKLSIDMAEEPIREADTIEELCDEFHIEYFSLDKKLSYVRFYDFEIAKQNNEDNDEIYGVIHIKGKGLIYVAKIDNEGKLVLI